MTAEQRRLFGDAVAEFTVGLGSPHGRERIVGEPAERLIDIVERVPAPVRASLDDDIEAILRRLREKLATTRGELRFGSARHV